jgi:hypothetical protein
MKFGQQFCNFQREVGSFSCPKTGTWDRLFYFPSEGRHAVDFSNRKNLMASVGSKDDFLKLMIQFFSRETQDWTVCEL